MKLISRFILATGMVLLPHLVQAQLSIDGSVNNDVAPVRPDSIVQVAAESQGLQLVLPEQVPSSGTFWWVMPGGTAIPTPCPPQDLSGATYQIADGQFLVDETGGQVVVNQRRLGSQAQVTSSIVASAAVSQADALVNLISQVQTTAENQEIQTLSLAMGMDVSGPPTPGDGDSGDGSGADTNSYSTYTFDHSQLWLEITNVSNGWSYLNLHNATNQVYAIWSTTNLLTPFTNWQVETEVWPTDTNCMPFTIQSLNRQNVFLRAEDWTGVTENGNTTPDWWFWEYFGTTALSDTNRDSQGNTLLSDYQDNTDPNIISFSLVVTNNYVNHMNASVQLNIVSGTPSCYAISVDDTNYIADAIWQSYAGTNITVNLGFSEGWHNVWVGLRGLPADATQTWQWKHLNLALPPMLVITNPVNGVINKPIIQIYGYCQEPIQNISYDISNASSSITGLPSEITDQYYDTNSGGFSTNYFECLDVPLANGLNTISLHATDLAGNITTTNYNFTLDYSSKTNPPVVQITWPQNGTKISGTSFTCRGSIDDPTSTVMTQLIQTNGGGLYTNIYSAEVERNGSFWLENLPISAGTNTFNITVRDAVGNTNTTTISIVQSSLVLTINPVIPDSQLWQPTVNLSGTLSSTNSAVWVNGVKGHNNGNGTWSANNVPVNNDGTASFTATAYESDEQQPDGSYGN
jgi:hypothetical protein